MAFDQLHQEGANQNLMLKNNLLESPENINKTRTISSLSLLALVVGIVALAASFLFLGKNGWGVLLSNFLYFTSLAQGSLIAVLIVRVASGHWGRRFFRLGQSINLAFMPFALVFMAAVLLGHSYIHFWAKNPGDSLWFNPVFFVTRNIIFFGLFYALALKLNKTSKTKGSDVTKKTYHSVTMNILFLFIVFVLGMTVFSWDMSMTLTHGYMDTIYTFRFIVGAIYSGLAFNFLIFAAVGKIFGIKILSDKLYQHTSTFFFALSIVWFYTWWAQFFPAWYSHMPEETNTLYAPTQGIFWYMYLGMMVFAWLIPWFSMLFTRVKYKAKGMVIVSSSILFGLWIQRYLEAVPQLKLSHMISGFLIFHPLNVLVTIGLFGGIFFVLIRIIKRYPEVIPTSEKALDDENDILISKPRGWHHIQKEDFEY